MNWKTVKNTAVVLSLGAAIFCIGAWCRQTATADDAHSQQKEQPAPAKAAEAKRPETERPIGTWVREVGEEIRVTLRFEADHLFVSAKGATDGKCVILRGEADYSVTKDSVLFAVITSFEVLDQPKEQAKMAFLLDHAFSARFRVDGNSLTIKELMFGNKSVPESGDDGEMNLVIGRYERNKDGAKDEPPCQPKTRKKSNDASTLPSPNYLDHPAQYIPRSPEFPLPKDETAPAEGAGTGAVAGGLMQIALAHAPVAGAVVGAATGAIVGSAIGQDEDIKQAKQAITADQAARGGPIPLDKIVELVHNNVSDGVIVDQIHATGTNYDLTPDHITWLHQEGVSDYVIHELSTPYRRHGHRSAETGCITPPPAPLAPQGKSGSPLRVEAAPTARRTPVNFVKPAFMKSTWYDPIAAYQTARGGSIPLEKIVKMVHRNVGDGVIVDHIRATGTHYELTPDRFFWLHQQGVCDSVIRELSTPTLNPFILPLLPALLPPCSTSDLPSGGSWCGCAF